MAYKNADAVWAEIEFDSPDLNPLCLPSTPCVTLWFWVILRLLVCYHVLVGSWFCPQPGCLGWLEICPHWSCLSLFLPAVIHKLESYVWNLHIIIHNINICGFVALWYETFYYLYLEEFLFLNGYHFQCWLFMFTKCLIYVILGWNLNNMTAIYRIFMLISQPTSAQSA